MTETLPGWLVSVMVLGPVLLVAAGLTIARPPRAGDGSSGTRLVGAFLVGVALQCGHVIEEFATGFPTRIAELSGFGPMSAEYFVAFNAAWLGVWALAGAGVLRGIRLAYLPVWFFALAMCLNGVLHPLLALRSGGYFPGLVTAPVVGVAGLWLTLRLLAATEAQPAVGAAP